MSGRATGFDAHESGGTGQQQPEGGECQDPGARSLGRRAGSLQESYHGSVSVRQVPPAQVYLLCAPPLSISYFPLDMLSVYQSLHLGVFVG